MLTRLYYQEFHNRTTSAPVLPVYFKLLTWLRTSRSELRPQIWTLLEGLRKQVAASVNATHGERTMIPVLDAFSYRSIDSKQQFAPFWHQDSPFWMTGQCSSFNVWVLLHAEPDTATTSCIDMFDVRDKKNQQPYASLYGNRALTECGETASWAAGTPPPICVKDGHRYMQWRNRMIQSAVQRGRVHRPALRIGDAMTVRQMELHKTDAARPLPYAARLGLVISFVEQATARLSAPAAPAWTLAVRVTELAHPRRRRCRTTSCPRRARPQSETRLEKVTLEL